MAACMSAARVPSDARCTSRASVEGGQYEAPIRPAAGVGSRRAHRHIRNGPEDEVQASHQSDHGLLCLDWAGKFLRRTKCNLQRRSTYQPHAHRVAAFDARCSGVRASNPHPPPGGSLSQSGHLPRWPGPHTSRPKGRARGDARAAIATAGLAQRGRRERCRALVRIDTRKHQRAWLRAFRPPNLSVTTGRAAEARVTSCEIKGAVSTGRRNTCAQPLGWRLEAQGLPRALVQS